ncbi:FxLYD domain-containing protein [Vreelandella utahensis]|uniref:FxLYD domain-containing protein n=1 Tax=Vreelandella halophila TaxID=86177 RepID=UPI0009857ED4|nr:FxLYD domain-containing protein [Halomonas utahensis]
MKKVLQWIGGFFVVLIVIGLVAGDPDSGPNFSTDSGASEGTSSGSGDGQDYEISDLGVERGEFGNERITGILGNNSGHEVSYVQVEINLYDSEGVQTGTTMANTNNLEADGKWRFKAMPTSDFSKYKVTGVSGF